MKITVNDKAHEIDVDQDTPLLWALREELALTGTKFGCGKGICGSCTVHVDGSPTRSCILPCSSLQDSKVTTIEAYQKADHPVQKAWIKHSVPQCGYCQSGQIMQAMGHLTNNSSMSENEILGGLSANLCRCGTYTKIKEALIEAAKEMGVTK